MPLPRAYTVVDVFSREPFCGNPVAVVLDAQGLSDAEMQTIARWTNLSETTFVLPPSDPRADYRLRIFTPASELPFAGHPTLGSAHAMITAGRVTPGPKGLVQECARGLVPIRVEEAKGMRYLVFTLPEAQVTPLGDTAIAELEAYLGAPIDRALEPVRVDVGAVWVVARLKSAQDVLALEPDLTRGAAFERRVKATGTSVYGPHEDGAPADIEVRSFCPADGIPEDPICGSGNGAVAVVRKRADELGLGEARYSAAQGSRVGRAGQIALRVATDGAVEVGGLCVTCASGHLHA
ncbi:PhzF family phenazine biosynthesis protein [Novosphingobium sp. BW1]|uniref:PhzF family phenazine biosynthesis protein n=1 Tax=Novosphingobium sp. BW1 TaxID=2592621 RepID=UPI0011DE7F38|nr:PhzF family phenazine biosynthesis protein [Novosphingobium sp. BW1]TYC85284.1 PhzF family phenazine biosynthesis protein [Novosphingobium sp. BW1]